MTASLMPVAESFQWMQQCRVILQEATLSLKQQTGHATVELGVYARDVYYAVNAFIEYLL